MIYRGNFFTPLFDKIVVILLNNYCDALQHTIYLGIDADIIYMIFKVFLVFVMYFCTALICGTKTRQIVN